MKINLKAIFMIFVITFSFVLVGFDRANELTDLELLKRGNIKTEIGCYVYDISSLSELLDKNETVVEAEVLSDKVNVISNYKGHTETNIKIKKVHKGEIKENDVITIREPYFRKAFDNEEYLVIHDNYDIAEVGKEYLFILRKKQITDKNNNIIDIYQMSNSVLGKYPIVNKKLKTNINVDLMSDEEIGLKPNEYSSSYNYRNIYKEIIDKYYN